MRILFDSKKQIHKEPFGCVTPGEVCTLRIHIPKTVGTTAVLCKLNREDGSFFADRSLFFLEEQGPYQVWQGSFFVGEPGLYFYYFTVTGACLSRETIPIWKPETCGSLAASRQILLPPIGLRAL